MTWVRVRRQTLRHCRTHSLSWKLRHLSTLLWDIFAVRPKSSWPTKRDGDEHPLKLSMPNKRWISPQHRLTPKMSSSLFPTSLASYLRNDFDLCSCASSGYTRVIMAGLSLHYMSYHPIYCTLLYSVSCLLDAVDGQAARALGQTSKFGAVLDMVTDRWVVFFRPTACLIIPS